MSDGLASGEPPARDACSAWRALVRVSASATGDAAGAWSFGEGAGGGMVFVERGRICWVVAQGLRRRLTSLLVAQSAASPEAIAEVVRGCKRSGTPLGEALVQAGLVTHAGLRRALCEHSAACLLRIDPELAVHFVPSQRRYDAALTFGGVELMEEACRAAAGPEDRDPIGMLDRAVHDGGAGVAFAFAGGKASHPLALRGMADWTVDRLQRLVARFGDLVRPPGPAGVEVSGFRVDAGGAVAWRVGDTVFLLLVTPLDTVPARVAAVRGMLRELGLARG